MAVKSVFDIKCFKDVQFWVEQSVLHYDIEIRKHFLKYHSPSPPPPRVPAKAFACICVTIFYTLYGSGLLAQGGGGGGKMFSSPKTRAKAHKMPFLPNKKLMTVMKFSRTNLLNCFVFCASLI